MTIKLDAAIEKLLHNQENIQKDISSIKTELEKHPTKDEFQEGILKVNKRVNNLIDGTSE